MEAYVEIIREDGTLERHPLHGEQTTVGRSPTAGVPIPDGHDLEPEHVRIIPRGGEGCWVAIKTGAKRGAKVRGEPFQHGIVPWGTEIDIGGFKLRVTDSLPKEKKEGQSSPVVAIGLVGIVAVLGWLMLSDPARTNLEMQAPTDPLSLFDAEAPCPATGAQALYRADQDAEHALAKSERYPFDSGDGIESVMLYRRAQACYVISGEPESAARMQREAEWMRQRIEEDFATHRVRLERAMTQERWPDALVETRALIALTRHRNHPYVEWLQRNARRLQLLLEQRSS